MKPQSSLAALLCAAMVLFNQPLMAWGQDAPASTPPAAPATTIPGSLLDVDGKTPWVGKLVRVVRTPSMELVTEVTTDAEGLFSVPLLEPGTYLVTVGGLVTKVTVTADKPVQSMKIVATDDLVNGETIPMADLQNVEVSGFTFLIIGGVIVIVALTATGFYIIGYNSRRTTGGRILGFPVSPFVP